VIQELLTATTRERFFGEHFQKAPYSEPASARSATSLMDWDGVARLISRTDRPDMIVSHAGRFLERSEPSSVEDAQVLFSRGCSIVLRNVERFDRAMKELADSFGREMEGDVSVHVFATPRSFMGFGWHYDCEDVFILQIAGTKDYFLRRNTVNPAPTLPAMPKDMQFQKETSAVITCTLVGGDWLYIPRGWWHMARGVDDSLSLSVGVLSPAARGET
jgi:ribosomal protein L16 Arg81 hydroxylase